MFDVISMYFNYKTFDLCKMLYFLIVTGPDEITEDTSTPKGNCNFENLCSNEKDQHHEDSLRSYMSISLWD